MGWITVESNKRGEVLERNYINKYSSDYYLTLPSGFSVFYGNDGKRALELFRAREGVDNPANV